MRVYEILAATLYTRKQKLENKYEKASKIKMFRKQAAKYSNGPNRGFLCILTRR